MKVYTKTGDKGTTGILGGTRLAKDHDRIEAYGTLDELNANVGLLRDQEGTDAFQAELIQIQEDLFTIGSHLASDPEKNKMTLPAFKVERIEALEAAMDAMDSTLPPLKNFVLPGGHVTISHCHVVRCVCRRAERATITLARTSYVQSDMIRFLNRLSDYFFVLSRKLAHDLRVEETPWTP
ncbi:cob(I)yrinic acid a,c-diamide adenosyltransferase [Sanyastnella coralliicola]|uniref:cob(I)yrinic acid a,c-diamide adenosyltransferase n=1 Tax=Sanyastnella coralliicola TaxID=3069118 RepID=UPI0027B905E2|nr:cob(I)yrinic acid a,c-diamide adenosyltransferase [Longitalea sp. SCSIO 12813]